MYVRECFAIVSHVLCRDLWPLEERISIGGQRRRLTPQSFLCSKVLLKYKRDKESFWHRHQKGTESASLLVFSKAFCVAAAAAKSLQSCSTLHNPMDCSLPGSSVHGTFQARVLEWGAIAFSGNSMRNMIFSIRELRCREVYSFVQGRTEQHLAECYWISESKHSGSLNKSAGWTTYGSSDVLYCQEHAI